MGIKSTLAPNRTSKPPRDIESFEQPQVQLIIDNSTLPTSNMKALSLPHGLFKGLTSTVRYRPVVQCRQFRTSTPFADTDRHPLDFSDRKEGEQSDEVEDGFTSLNPSPRRKYRRLIPASPSYFTTRPGFTDDFIAIKELQRKCSGLPRLPPDMVESIAWKRSANPRVCNAVFTNTV